MQTMSLRLVVSSPARQSRKNSLSLAGTVKMNLPMNIVSSLVGGRYAQDQYELIGEICGL